MEEPLSNSFVMIDEVYEFSAPRFYDFVNGESEEDVCEAELWFDRALSYAPSPFMPKIKATRSIQLQTLCNFDEEDETPEAAAQEPSETATVLNSVEEQKPINQTKPPPQSETISVEVKEVETNSSTQVEVIPAEIEANVSTKTFANMQNLEDKQQTVDVEEGMCTQETKASSSLPVAKQGPEVVCTPAPTKPSTEKKKATAQKIASMIRNPSVMNSKNKLQKSQLNSTKPASSSRFANAKNTIGTPNFVHDNQAIKRQKLEGGKTRQILTVNKPSNLPHKTKNGIMSSSINYTCSANAKSCKEDRKMYVREPAAPFVSMAEMMKKFQSSTRDSSISLVKSNVERKPRVLTLTRPKTPEFETSQRARPVKIKSSAELEEEMMAKIPKFKARPINKKILEASALPSLPRSTPQPPEFKEFHLETMSRANHNVETSVESTQTQNHQNQNHHWRPDHLTAPKSPVLHTSLRARPPKIKSSEELEKETLENIPQFKARPLNRKIFESKGEMGISSNMKKQVTIPQEFHFAIDKRIPPSQTAVLDLFDKLSINSEAHREKPLHRNTTPDPFHLQTEERGAEKERRLYEELMQKQLEEERARIPKAHPYPYTTDFPVFPPRPEPKPCTKPEPFQLESLVRHEEEMQREMEEKRRMEMEDAQRRMFKAQPILKEDPIPVPEIERKPLTEVQEFNLHVDNRAIDRAEFDNKIKEKEMMYKRYRDEADSARMMEEEKALKQLRRTLVPHARPVPKFDHPFLPQKSDKGVTKAKSPNLHVNRRKENRRIVFPAAASSAAASHMR